MAYTKSTVLHVNHDALSGDTLRGLSSQAGNPRELFNALARFFEDAASGKIKCSVDVQLNCDDYVYASATATLVDAGATDSITINGVEFAAVVSGATGNQWNIGADDTADAVNLAAAINASTTARVAGVVRATSALGVVTIRAKQPGLAGNCFTLTDTGTTITVTGSGFLASGTGGDATAVTYSRS
jgi:phage tail sheath gpL-like